MGIHHVGFPAFECITDVSKHFEVITAYRRKDYPLEQQKVTKGKENHPNNSQASVPNRVNCSSVDGAITSVLSVLHPTG